MPQRDRARARRPVDEGYTLIELIVVVLIVGIMATVAIGSFAGVVGGMNNSLAQVSLQATRVSLAASTVATGTLPMEDGVPIAIPSRSVGVPSGDASFKIGYRPGCFQILNNAGSSTNVWLAGSGACDAADHAAHPTTGVKPLVETVFVLCAQYGSGPIYIADSWRSVREYVPGGTWPDGGAMDLHGCVPTPITEQGGDITPQL